MDGPHRFAGRTTGRSGDAGDRQAGGRRRMRQRTLGHGAGNFLADRAVTLDQCAGDAQKLAFRRIRMGDEATFDEGRTAGQRGQRCRHQAAGAGFGQGDGGAADPTGLHHLGGLGQQFHRQTSHYKISMRRSRTMTISP